MCFGGSCVVLTSVRFFRRPFFLLTFLGSSISSTSWTVLLIIHSLPVIYLFLILIRITSLSLSFFYLHSHTTVLTHLFTSVFFVSWYPVHCAGVSWKTLFLSCTDVEVLISSHPRDSLISLICGFPIIVTFVLIIWTEGGLWIWCWYILLLLLLLVSLKIRPFLFNYLPYLLFSSELSFLRLPQFHFWFSMFIY